MIMETLINDHIEERINIPCCQVYNCFSKKQSKKKTTEPALIDTRVSNRWNKTDRSAY